MKKYLLIFRMDVTSPEAQPSPEQMEEYNAQWMSWINEISANEQLAPGGNHLSHTEAMVISSGSGITQGPYMARKKSVAGYIIILAKDLENARTIALKCPILEGEGNSVEIRAVAAH
ncbi:MAG: YciI family protein [Owenweeksia sp.]